MKSIRTLAAAAASVAIAGALIIGAGLPANAATVTNFPPHPIVPGPKVPPIPPGTVFRPVVQLPTCDVILPQDTLDRAATQVPGFYLQGSATGSAPADPGVASHVYSNRYRSCVYGSFIRPVWITEVAITSSDYSQLEQWYHEHAISTWIGGRGGISGTYLDTMYQLNDLGSHSTVEWGFLSTDGWWISISDHGNDLPNYVISDAARQFLAYNPSRS